MSCCSKCAHVDAVVKASGAFSLVPTARRVRGLARYAEWHPTARPFFHARAHQAGQVPPSAPDSFTTAVSPEQAMLDASAALQAAAQTLMGGSLSSSAIAMMLGQAMGESMFGRLVTGYGTDMAGTNNWGSVTANSSWQSSHAGQPGWGMFAHTDSIPGVRSYVAWFRIYPSQLEGAKGYLGTIMYEGASATLNYISQGPAAFAQYLSNHHYYTASVATYTQMLQGMQATASAKLVQAQTEGLTAADPTTTTANPAVIATITKRLTSGLLANPVDANGNAAPLPNAEGIVWFGAVPNPAGTDWGGVATVAGEVAVAAAAGGALAWWALGGRLPRFG